MTVFPSGEQFEIRHGSQRATIVEVGAGIREYEVDGRPVLDPYPAEAMCDGAHGAPLIPWPNRLGDGRYSFDGQDYQLPITEPEHGNAIHGLLRWRNWRPVERSEAHIVMGITLYPQPGWPFALEISVSYGLVDGGLSVQTSARNSGGGPCPFGSGQHPYLSPGAGATLDQCTLSFAADTRILTDPDRQLPSGSEPVPGGEFDFHSERLIGTLQIDDPFTDLARDAEGRAWVRLLGSDGRTVELWADASYPVIQLYTGDTLARGRRRQGMAAEPMTCPPNALASGERIVRLEPGESHVSRWGVGLR
jgi:aldose 1-epimerase